VIPAPLAVTGTGRERWLIEVVNLQLATASLRP
jgi:hypothetical protein